MGRRSLEEIRDSAALAAVRLAQTGGQGVLVGKSFLVTAAHCLRYDQRDGMAPGAP
ncbi:MAG TPA: hypothetical protein VE080_00430 [Candidatus Aquicultoraceae bacterium]|nr:hypothetical protein [Candidatus Aquicultoraceae bacterium]